MNFKDFYPRTLADLVGKPRLKKRLRTHLIASLKKSSPFPHSLLYGPPGLGKTAVPHAIASEMKVGLKYVSAPSLNKVGHLISALVNLEEGDILLLDEIHRLPRAVEEVLYKVLDSSRVSVVIGSGVSGRVLDIDIAPFSLFGTTTLLHRVSSPLRSRFQIVERLDFYSEKEMLSMARRYAGLLSMDLKDELLVLISNRARGTPRNLINLLKNLHDFVIANSWDFASLDSDRLNEFFENFGIYEYGLTSLDIEYIRTLYEDFSKGPVGIETIATSLGEDPSTLESEVEPFLLRLGFIKRTRRGRVLTPSGENFYKGFQFNTFQKRL